MPHEGCCQRETRAAIPFLLWVFRGWRESLVDFLLHVMIGRSETICDLVEE